MKQTLSQDQIIANALFKSAVNSAFRSKQSRGTKGWNDKWGAGVTRNAARLYAKGVRNPTFAAAMTVANELGINLGKMQRDWRKIMRAK